MLYRSTAGSKFACPEFVLRPHLRLRYNHAVNADHQRLVAEAMAHPGEAAGDVVAAFIAELGMPGRLLEVGVERARFREVADHAIHEEWIHVNPRRITQAEQVMEILEAAA